jgi:hypothetical protein
MAGPRSNDLQGFAVDSGRIQAQIEGALAFGQALAGCGLERFNLGIVVGRAQMLNLAGTAPHGPYDLHRQGPEVVFTVRTEATEHPRSRDLVCIFRLNIEQNR